eukprot:694795-Prymnesium_polylepis.1
MAGWSQRAAGSRRVQGGGFKAGCSSREVECTAEGERDPRTSANRGVYTPYDESVGRVAARPRASVCGGGENHGCSTARC